MTNLPLSNQLLIQQYRPLITEQSLLTASPMTLIPDNLTITILNHGHGLHPISGQFIRFKLQSYICSSSQLQFLKQQTIQVAYNREKIIPALEMAMSFMKQGSLARVWTSSMLACKDQLKENISSGSSLVLDIKVYSISEELFVYDEASMLKFLEEIFQQNKEGDQKVRRGKFQQALHAYERAVTKIQSKKFNDALTEYLSKKAKIDHTSQKQSPSLTNECKTQKKQQLYRKFHNVCLKYLELCFSVGEYLKVTITSNKLIRQIKLEKSQRLSSLLVRTFLELGEIGFAEKWLENLKVLNQGDKLENIECFQKQIQKAKSTLSKVPS